MRPALTKMAPTNDLPQLTCIVAAVAGSYGIGKDGTLPWKLARDPRPERRARAPPKHQTRRPAT